jgi:DNA-binding SARP family transcriptional activator
VICAAADSRALAIQAQTGLSEATVQIQTLGPFEVRVCGLVLPPAGAKPAALLKVLVALGGKHVSRERVSACLWARTGASSTRGSFDTTLHRLRRWLGNDALVRLHQGQLSLDPDEVWVDADAFDSPSSLAASEPTLDAMLARMALYNGRFLQDLGAAAWAERRRDRLHGQYLLLALRVGLRYERDTRWTEAVLHYERALERDDIYEPFYEGWMRSLIALERRWDANRAYELCRRRLQQDLAREPSAATRALLDG